MKAKFAVLILALFALAALAGQTTKPGEQKSVAPASRVETPAAKPATASAEDQQEIESLRADVKRMRVLLNQMQVNLAFVQSSDTPLKHQFNLNNDMWQILLTDMERRLNKLERQKP